MVKVPKLKYTISMSRRKYYNIRDIDKYKQKVKEGIFEKYKFEVSRLQKRNFVIKWLNDYKYKYYLTKYKTPEHIIIEIRNTDAEKEAVIEALARPLIKQNLIK